MTARPDTRRPADGGRGTANERYKRSFDTWLWGSMIAAVVFHFGVFQAWPEMAVALPPADDDEPFEVTRPVTDEFEPPERIERPAPPVIGDDVDPAVTITPTDFDRYVPEVAPPVDDGSADLGLAPTFTPFTVRPEILNRGEVQRTLTRAYPALLRDAGIGGTVSVHVHIDETGVVRATRIHRSSGHPQLDAAAREVAGIMRFSPALNRDRRVPVWISVPVVFQVR